jgi:hypothetical protein
VTGSILATLLSATFLAAVVGAIVNTTIARKKSLEEERSRVRTTYAEAFEAVAAYKELPYAIRRRRADQSSEERVRLSELGREIQGRLSYYLAWTRAESDEVGAAYARLVERLRATAGSASNRAWQEPPVASDAEMNLGKDKVDLGDLATFEEAYVNAVVADLRSRGRWRQALPSGSRRKRNDHPSS